jgi:NAD(P)H-hydrate epimerase
LAVDADGLNVLAKMDRRVLSERQCALVLTPHVKEFARLTGHTVEDIFDNFIPYAQAYARQIGGVVVLKGPTSVVTDGERVALISVGSPGMATAGSGDVLSGVLAATLAYVEDIFDATCLAVYINGRAGAYAAQEMGVTSMVASDTVAQIARVTKQLAGE